jgi:RNA polymerase primary sigma factor
VSGGEGHPRSLRPAAQRERELVAATEMGDATACERLVDTFMPRIGAVARIYRRVPSVDRSELMQEGVVGLLRAAGRYDPRMGIPFWAYASWWVRQAMQQLVAEMTQPVVLSDRALRRLARIRDARSESFRAHQRDPSIADLVAATGFKREQVESLLASERTPRSLEQPLAGEEGTGGTYEDLVEDPAAEEEYDRVLEDMEIAEFRDLSEGLGERERAILFAHYGLRRPAETLRQIAEGLGLSVERVRQIEERALGKLREAVLSPPAA